MVWPLEDRRHLVVSDATFVLAGFSALLAQLAPLGVIKACRMSSFSLWSETQSKHPCLAAFARVEKAWALVRTSARDAACHLVAAARMQPGVSSQHDLEGRVVGFLQMTDNCHDGQSVPEAYLVRRSALQLMRAWRMPALIEQVQMITDESAEQRGEEYMAGVDRNSINDSMRRFFYERCSYADAPDLLIELDMAFVQFERTGQMESIVRSWPACAAASSPNALDPHSGLLGSDSTGSSSESESGLASQRGAC
jgi:hypothetical protein